MEKTPPLEQGKKRRWPNRVLTLLFLCAVLQSCTSDAKKIFNLEHEIIALELSVNQQESDQQENEVKLSDLKNKISDKKNRGESVSSDEYNARLLQQLINKQEQKKQETIEDLNEKRNELRELKAENPL